VIFRLAKQRRQVVVVERVRHFGALSSSFDQTAVAKKAKPVRDCGLRHADQDGEVAYA